MPELVMCVQSSSSDRLPGGATPSAPASVRGAERSRLPRRPAARRAAARAGSRGFTLIELTVVVIIIGVFAALAMPQVTKQLKDRRTHEAAQRVALIYQQARMRALGQGGSVLVRYKSDGTGSFETRERLVGKVGLQKCKWLPAVACMQPGWDNSTDELYRSIETVDLQAQPGLDGKVTATVTQENGTDSATVMDVCFTPLGRAFIRYSTADADWHTPAGVPQIRVARMNGSYVEGLARKVLVLPTGIARLQL